MRKIGTVILSAAFFVAQAQLPDDALRYSYPFVSGTARSQAIGGAIGSLGGDLSSAHINPAGIGLYKTREVVFSPDLGFNRNKFDYRGSSATAKASSAGLGTSGVVFGHQNSQYRKASSAAFSLSINQLANYNNHISYKGLNNTSSWTEQYLEEAQRDLAGKSKSEIVSALENNYIFGTSLAYYTFLVDTASAGNQFFIQSQVPLARPGASGAGVIQTNDIQTRGGAHEVALAFANSFQDKFHFGFSFNIPVYSFTRNQTYREEDASPTAINDFSFFEYKERYTANGIGFNGKLGIIYRPVSKLRLGLAFHTPTFVSMKDVVSASISANTEKYTNKPQPITYSSDQLKGDNSTAGVFQYELTTPIKLVGSASYVINEVGDVKQQRGFISADVEYINQGGTRYSPSQYSAQDDVAYYDALNKVIRERFKGVMNLKVGGELKFNTLMTRAGFAYFSNPYRSKAFKGSRMVFSGGLGYRNRGYFVDLTYLHAIINASHVPYYLQDKATPVADARNIRGSVVLSFGVKI